MSEQGESRSLALPATAELTFDPDRPTVLAGRGLALLEAKTGYLPPPEVPPGGIEKLLAHFATQLGMSMLIQSESHSGPRRLTFSPEQSALALCCLYVCAHASRPVAPFGTSRLGAVTDLVADERRFWWWNALTLQVALNAGGEGNGGIRALYGNLAHPQETVRQQMLRIAWFARGRLSSADAAGKLLENVEMHTAHWPASLAVLRALCDDAETFRGLIRAYTPRYHPRRFRGRVSALNERNDSLVRYVENPDDILSLERDIRRRVEARIVGI